jgi:hypothetical protein
MSSLELGNRLNSKRSKEIVSAAEVDMEKIGVKCRQFRVPDLQDLVDEWQRAYFEAQTFITPSRGGIND